MNPKLLARNLGPRPATSARPTVPSGARRQIAVLAALLISSLGLVENRAQQTPPWKAPAFAAHRANPISPTPASISKGKELFVTTCLPCHGPEGKGDGPAAASLQRNGAAIKPANLSDPKLWDEPDGALFWKISQGNSPMPAFGEALTPEQRWEVVNYVRTLAPRNLAKK